MRAVLARIRRLTDPPVPGAEGACSLVPQRAAAIRSRYRANSRAMASKALGREPPR